MSYRDNRLKTHIGVPCWYCNGKEKTYYEENICTGCGANERISLGMLRGEHIFGREELQKIVLSSEIYLVGEGGRELISF